MKTRIGWVVLGSSLALAAFRASAQMIVLEGVNSSTLTTGDLLDGVGSAGITTNVVEVPGLEISARSGAEEQDINVTVGSLGITIFNSGDDTDAFDVGERVIFSFNKTVQINRLDFNQFSAGESVWMSVGDDAVEIADLDLSNRNSDYLDTNLVVAAHVEIGFYTTGSSTVGLDGIDVTVLGGDPELSLVFNTGTAMVSAIFDGSAPTNYVLQYRADLGAGDWTTISDSFSTNSEWQVDATNSCGYFRAVAP